MHSLMNIMYHTLTGVVCLRAVFTSSLVTRRLSGHSLVAGLVQFFGGRVFPWVRHQRMAVQDIGLIATGVDAGDGRRFGIRERRGNDRTPDDGSKNNPFECLTLQDGHKIIECLADSGCHGAFTVINSTAGSFLLAPPLRQDLSSVFSTCTKSLDALLHTSNTETGSPQPSTSSGSPEPPITFPYTTTSSTPYAASASTSNPPTTRSLPPTQASQTVSGGPESASTSIAVAMIVTSQSRNTNPSPSSSQPGPITAVAVNPENPPGFSSPVASSPVSSGALPQSSGTTQTPPSPWGSPSPGEPPLSPSSSEQHGPNTGEILAIVLGVLALLLCIAFAVLFFLRRRARERRKARRTSRVSAWQRLKPHVYDGSSSRPESSIWTWFGSIPIDTDYKPPQLEHRPYSPESHLAEKGADPPTASGLGGFDASSSHPSPCPSPAPSDTRPSSTRSLHEGLPYLTVPIPSPLEAPPSSTELLALAGTDYAVANPFSDVHEVRVGRSMSGGSRTTASSGDVQSVEAL